jgi:hypothetical protein
MNPSPRPSSRVRNPRAPFVLSLFLSAWLCAPAYAQELVPGPKQAFTPKAALIVYADLQTASNSGIWSALQHKMAPLAEQFSSMPGLQNPMPGNMQNLPGLASEDTAEMVVLITGENALQNLAEARFDPDFGFIVIARLVRSVDTEQLINQVLDAVDQQQPGLRASIEPSRARVGAAEFFDLPAELLGPTSVPFPVSAAVGQSAEGTVIGFGKADSLRAFLTTQNQSALPAGIAGQLARRSQMWVYLPLPQTMLQDLSASAGTGNPMVGGLAEGMEKVREFGLGLSFGSKIINVELALGCTDAPAAQQLTQNLQQFLGLLQMMSAQNPGGAPPFLSKIKAATDNAAFRLTSELTERDFDLALQTVNPGAKPGARRPTGPAPLPPVVMPETQPVPVTVEVLELLPGDLQALRHTRMRIDNQAPQAVRNIRLTLHYFDRKGQRIGQWTRRHLDPVSDTLVAAESSREFRSPAFHVPTSTHRVTAVLHEVTFADGSKWSTGR